MAVPRTQGQSDKDPVPSTWPCTPPDMLRPLVNIPGIIWAVASRKVILSKKTIFHNILDALSYSSPYSVEVHVFSQYHKNFFCSLGGMIALV